MDAVAVDLYTFSRVWSTVDKRINWPVDSIVDVAIATFYPVISGAIHTALRDEFS